jgi:hypothetical protein
MEDVRRAYRRNELVLFLGAGISLDAGLPNWNTLLSRLLVAMIGERLPGNLSATEKEKTAMAQDLQKLHAASPLLEARYIRKGLGDTFGDAVGRSLYEGLPADVRVTSATLDAIARLCVPRRDGPGIRAIVTYNFDDLLERHLKDVDVKAKPVYREGDGVAPDELGVFHVHGFLPRETGAYDGLSESLLVFSEEGYHEVYLDAYSWSNMVQLGFLRDSIGLFVGLSVTDPNLRRLLDIAAKKNKAAKHFVVLKRQLSSDFLEASALSESRAEVIEAFLSAHHLLQEASFEELGLKSVWLQHHDEIPSLLTSIKA